MCAGIVKSTSIPMDLMVSLRRRVRDSPQPKRVTSPASEVEKLFNVNDVVKVRVQTVSLENCVVDLTMLPMTPDELATDDRDEDSNIALYTYDSAKISDEELIEMDNSRRDMRRRKEIQRQERKVDFNGETTLLWWNGAPFVPNVDPNSPAAVAAKQKKMKELDPYDLTDQELADFNHNLLINENENMVRGQWIQQVEQERENELKKHEKTREDYMKKIDEEIGPLLGIHEALKDPLKLGIGAQLNRFGYHMSREMARKLTGVDEEAGAADSEEVDAGVDPDEVAYQNEKDLDNFYDELERAAKTQEKILRGGMKGDLARLQALINTIRAQAELQPRQAQQPLSRPQSRGPYNRSYSPPRGRTADKRGAAGVDESTPSLAIQDVKDDTGTSLSEAVQKLKNDDTVQ
jgi:hypothetical protein